MKSSKLQNFEIAIFYGALTFFAGRAVSNKEKLGFCPIIKEPRESCSSVKCSVDNDCNGMQKCCDVPGCGKTCQEPSFTSMSMSSL